MVHLVGFAIEIMISVYIKCKHFVRVTVCMDTVAKPNGVAAKLNIYFS